MELSLAEAAALLYACEDNGELYVEDEDADIAAMGRILIRLIPRLKDLVTVASI